MTVAHTELTSDTDAPARARSWARETVTEPALVDDVVLCISELVANAVQAGCTRICLNYTSDSDQARLSVADDAPTMPSQRPLDPDATRGRGLHVVAALSAAWGVEPNPDGKEVWVVFARDPDP